MVRHRGCADDGVTGQAVDWESLIKRLLPERKRLANVQASEPVSYLPAECASIDRLILSSRSRASYFMSAKDSFNLTGRLVAVFIGIHYFTLKM